MFEANADQGARDDDRKFRVILAEILGRGQDLGRLLGLVKEKESILIDLGVISDFKISKDCFGVRVILDVTARSGIPAKIDEDPLLKLSLGEKFLNRIGFPNLSCPRDEKRLSARVVLPFDQFLEDGSFHRFPPRLFYKKAPENPLLNFELCVTVAHF